MAIVTDKMHIHVRLCTSSTQVCLPYHVYHCSWLHQTTSYRSTSSNYSVPGKGKGGRRGGVVGLFSSCNRRVHPVDGTPNRMGKGPSPSLKVFVDHSSLRYLVNYVGYIIVYTARAGYRHAIDLTAGM